MWAAWRGPPPTTLPASKLTFEASGRTGLELFVSRRVVDPATGGVLERLAEGPFMLAIGLLGHGAHLGERLPQRLSLLARHAAVGQVRTQDVLAVAEARALVQRRLAKWPQGDGSLL